MAMTEIRFYHLQRTTLEAALPPMLEKTLERGQRAVVLAGSDERVEQLTDHLWTYDEGGFLPHGSARDGNAAVPADLADDRGREPERGASAVPERRRDLG